VTRPSAEPGVVFQSFRFIRGSTLGFTLTLPVAGAATVGPVGGVDALLVMAPALAFHIFIYVLNDVVDLPLDRSEPRRREFPLVTGAISPRAALTVALAVVPVGLGTAVLSGAPAPALAVLALAFVAGAGYDVWGKRTALPPVTDLVQGLAWAGLLAYGAAASGGPTALTVWLAAYVVTFIVLVNGLHGGLRDLTNDLQHGARTTAILFGARPRTERGVTLPAVLVGYAVILQVGLVLTALAAAATGSGTATTGAVIALLVGASLCLAGATRRAGEPGSLRHLGALHVLTCLLVLVVLTAPRLSPGAVLLLVTVFVGPLAVDRATVSALTWLLGRRRPPVQRTTVEGG
jgi:4-hydroxybenzoate polyprenyltransferase